MEIHHDQPAAVSRYGLADYGFEGMLSSSADRGWSGLSAQLCRTVRKGVIPWRTPQSDIRICVDTHGNGALVTRRAPGVESRVIARRGTVWLSPPGLQEGSVDIAEDLTGILHIYLPVSHFSPSNFEVDVDPAAVSALSYERAFEDPLLAEIGFAIASELQSETSAGGLLIGALASSLAARLVQKYVTASSAQSFPRHTVQGLDRRKLLRVLDYIEANLEGDLSLERMASIACLSRYHFARAFKQAVGQPPHRYVSAKRLDRAKALLMQGQRSLVDIALSLSFSDQASFTRAFRQATGQAPGQYRRELGSREPVKSLTVIRQPFASLA
ncbi:helix-turn-helix domain-containing protein [Bradyrhizobium sp. CCBAU 051011]|uniref:helix-turn-helix domain-containing protein n=1 Tax=Bradyrhizobium sp. CCBAU 051011 TaxID=858422 RepID=UPI001FEE68E6|nr:helix-turn-helix domain-containing protein [Bradyrhizobium sp. CCBAU 051011]